MTVFIDSVLQTSAVTYEIKWSSSIIEVVYYIYQDGRLINTTTATSQQFTVLSGENLVVEILDSADAIPIAAFPAKITLGWYASENTKHYRIEEFNQDWILKAIVKEVGTGFYSWRTRFLEDVTTHKFRIIPVDNNNNNGIGREFNVFMVRHPDPPNLKLSYFQDTQKIIIS